MKPIWVNYTGQRTTESGVDGFVWKTHYFHQLVIPNFQPRPDSIFCSLRMVLWCPISKNVSHDICHHNPSYPQMFSDISYTRSIVVKLPIDPITIPSVPFRCPGQCFAWRCWLPDVNGAIWEPGKVPESPNRIVLMKCLAESAKLFSMLNHVEPIQYNSIVWVILRNLIPFSFLAGNELNMGLFPLEIRNVDECRLFPNCSNFH